MPSPRTLCLAAIVFLAPGTAWGQVTVAGWDFHDLTGGANNFGASPQLADTTDSGVTVGGLLRGPGVGTSGTGAGRAYGGNDWVTTSAAAAIAAGDYFSFTITPTAGNVLSLSQVSQFSYRRSGTGPVNGLLQYSLDGTNFIPIANLAYTSTSSSGANLAAIDLSGFSDLQNIPDSTTVTFLFANYNPGGTGNAGTWYFFDSANTAANDLAFQGTVTEGSTPVPEPSVVLGICAAGLGVTGLVRKRRALANDRS